MHQKGAIIRRSQQTRCACSRLFGSVQYCRYVMNIMSKNGVFLVDYQFSTDRTPDSVGGKTLTFLLMEGKAPIRLDLEATLRKRFPSAHIERAFPYHTKSSVNAISWDRYDLVLISCPSSIGQLSWLQEIKQVDGAPVVIVLTDEKDLGREAVWEGADAHVLLDESSSEFASRLDAMLEVGRWLHAFPLVLPEWHLREVLHNSENALVFLAENRHGELGVVKRFKMDMQGVAPESYENFLQGSRALVQLRHPHLVHILDSGVNAQGIYMVMDYVEGSTLKFYLQGQERIDLSANLILFRQITEAVAAIHAAALLHRDLKTSNILLRDDGTPVLLDYGIETQLMLDTGFISDNEIYCTPYYVSPERITGEPATVQSDLYALGVLLFELLTGKKPYDQGSLSSLLKMHLFAPLPELPDALRPLQPLLHALLAKLPEDRPASAAEVLAQLDAVSLTQ